MERGAAEGSLSGKRNFRMSPNPASFANGQAMLRELPQHGFLVTDETQMSQTVRMVPSRNRDPMRATSRRPQVRQSASHPLR
jgi:hypothetical protein